LKKEGNFNITTLTFVFNKDKLREAGYTEDELLQPMREHAKKYEIAETEKRVFSKEGEDAMEKRKQLTFDIDTNVAKEILGEQKYRTNLYQY